MLRYALFGDLLIAAALPAQADPVIARYAIHAGGTSRASGGSYELAGTLGQAAPGPSSGGEYVLDAGFLGPVDRVRADAVFNNGFEGA